MTEVEFFKDHTDEHLFEELRGCCNPRCNVIEEVIRRFNEYKGPRNLEEPTDEI